jgi:hypothetical protein
LANFAGRIVKEKFVGLKSNQYKSIHVMCRGLTDIKTDLTVLKCVLFSYVL